MPAGVLAVLALGLGGLSLVAPAATLALGRMGAAVGWGVRRVLTVLLLGGLYLAVFPVGRLLFAASGKALQVGMRGAVAPAGWRPCPAQDLDPSRSA